MNIKTIAKNPTAYHNYIIEDKIETGIVLSGTEIKSIRNGKINLYHYNLKNVFALHNTKLEQL